MKLRVIAPILVTASLLSACGGGSDSPPATDTPVTPVTPVAASTSLSGLASKGPLKSAMVSAFAIAANGTVGAKLAETESDATGAYTLNLGAYSGAVQLVVAVIPGKTKSKDEATGADVSLPDDFKLRANTTVTAPTGSTSVVQSASITPFTELANQIALDSGGLSAANLASASKVVFDLIGVDPVATKPLDASVAPPANATDAEKRYALFNAAVSAMANSAPMTTDATTRACFTAAAAAAPAAATGMKIKCATDQIAKSVTVTPATAGAAATLVPNLKLVGLGAALVRAATNETINKTGITITADGSDAKHLDDVEKDVIAGTITPIKLVVTAEETSDIAKAKLFFSRLRSNAAALADAPLDTGLADGVKAFGDSIRGESLAVAGDTADVVRLAKIASDLWAHYQSGATTNVNSPAIQGFPGGCTVFRGDFPTLFGGTAGEAGQAYTGVSPSATSTTDASWVGCSLNQGLTPTTANLLTQYRRSILFNTGAATAPGSVPYIAVTRKRYIDTAKANALTQLNLTPTLSGVIGYAMTGEMVTSAKIVGDLPPGVNASGALMAARHPVSVDGSLTTLASGASKVSFASGSFGVVPVGASTASLAIDLSPGGVTEVIAPDDNTNAAQVADAKLHISASIKTANGELTGTLVADTFTLDSYGDLQPAHAKFSGSIAAAGKGGTVATFFSGALEGSNGAQPVVRFDGTLTLPSRPVMTLSLSVTETAAATATAKAAYTLTGRYVQDAVSVQISGTQAAAGDSLTLADSSGVSVSKTGSRSGAAEPINVLVSGRQTARVDQDRDRIVYADGTFESLN